MKPVHPENKAWWRGTFPSWLAWGLAGAIAGSAPAAPVLSGPFMFTDPDTGQARVLLYCTQAGGRGLVIEASDDGGATWRFAGGYPPVIFDQEVALTYPKALGAGLFMFRAMEF